MVKLALHSIAYEAKTLNLSKEGYTTFYVDGKDGKDTNDGGSWAQAFETINHAIDESESWCKIYIKSKANSLLDGTAAAAQKDVEVIDVSDFIIGDKVIIRREDNYTEFHVIDSIDTTLNILTLVSDLANEYYAASSIVIAYYDEHVPIPRDLDGISLIGESKTTTVVSTTTSNTISIVSDNVEISNIGCMANMIGKSAIYLNGRYATISDCLVDGTGLATTNGIAISGSGYNVIRNVKTATPGGLAVGIYSLSDDNDIFDCIIDGQTTGVLIHTSNRNKVFNNEIKNCTTGLRCYTNAGNNSIFNNNFDSNTAQVEAASAPATNVWFENFFSNHITDTSGSGLCDTVYTENSATDKKPVGSRNGWKQASLGSVL